MDTVEKLPQPLLAPASQPRDPSEMGRAELEAYLQNTECFPTKVSLLEFARNHNIPVNGRTQRDEIIRLCLRMLHDIPASFAGLRNTERKTKTERPPSVESRKTLQNFFVGAKLGDRADGHDFKKVTSVLLDSIFNCHEAGLLLARARDADAEALRQALEICARPVETHLRFLGAVTDFLRLETGQCQLTRAPFRLRECVDEVLRQLALPAHHKGLELCGWIRTGAPECVVGDSERLRQILIPLLENAITSTDSGEVVVEVSQGEPGDQVQSVEEEHVSSLVIVRFTVRGAGRGVSQEKLQEAKPSGSVRKNNAQPSLSEFGLPLAQRFVEFMGGKLEIPSESDQGVRYSFALRFGEDNTNKDGPSSQFVALRERPILVVDDNENHRRILEELLKAWGANVTLAANGQEALVLLRGQAVADSFAVIVLDGQLADIEEFAAAQRQQVAAGSDRMSPIIMMFTTTVPAQEMEQYRDLNVAAFLRKPLILEELQQALQKALLAPRMSLDEQVFDREALWSLVEGDSSLLQEVIRLFGQDCPRLFFALQHASMAKHGQRVVTAVQVLKGVVSAFAAPGVFRILSLIEDWGRGNDFTNMQEALTRLTIELSRLQCALESFGQEFVALPMGKNARSSPHEVLV